MKSLLLSLALVGSAIVACSGPGAGKAVFMSGDVESKSTDDDDDDDTLPSSSSSSSGGGGDEVFANSTFSYKNPGQNANDHGVTHTGQTPLEGKDCVTAGCHLDTKPWAFAGTVYTAADATTTVAEAEIGIVYPDNKTKSTMTDQQGNFWFAGTEADYPPAGAKVGVRIAGKATKIMNTPLPAPPDSRACNKVAGCHGTATLRIYAN